MDRTSQVLQRNIESVRGSSILIVNFAADAFSLELQRALPDSRITHFSSDYANYRALLEAFRHARMDASGIVYDAWYRATEPHDAAIIYLPKSRALIEMTLAMTASALAARAEVFLVGESNAGIRSSKPALERYVGQVLSSDAARHCVLYMASMEAEPTSRPTLDDWAETYSVEVRGQTLEVVHLPGVFSQGRLDLGTRFFLEQLELPAGASVLDFGCGAGVIGATVKKLWPDAGVEMVDSNALALEASRRTMKANALSGASITATDVFSDVRDTYTHILSNPPFHTGVETDYRVVEEFFREAARHLKKNGSLLIVANRFLKYQPLIEKHVGQTRILAENKSYRVYQGIRKP